MSKAILVRSEMPESCQRCDFRNGMICTLTCGGLESYFTKPDWCPWKKSPEPMEMPGSETKDENGGRAYLLGLVDGWNGCLKTILGDENEFDF